MTASKSALVIVWSPTTATALSGTERAPFFPPHATRARTAMERTSRRAMFRIQKRPRLGRLARVEYSIDQLQRPAEVPFTKRDFAVRRRVHGGVHFGPQR